VCSGAPLERSLSLCGAASGVSTGETRPEPDRPPRGCNFPIRGPFLVMAMDGESFERVVRMHKDRVHTYAALLLRDPAEALDVAQEALIRLWRHRSRVSPAAARPWLMRTAHNLCMDLLRKRKVRAEIDDAEAVVRVRADSNPGPGQLAESDELGRRIQATLGTLSPQDRAVVVMREVQGLPYDEIAETLGMPLGTLKARLHRARERLRAKLTRVGVTP
jgi:RNA polymerase sigma-70 factor (ECF subfamily)